MWRRDNKGPEAEAAAVAAAAAAAEGERKTWFRLS